MSAISLKQPFGILQRTSAFGRKQSKKLTNDNMYLSIVSRFFRIDAARTEAPVTRAGDLKRRARFELGEMTLLNEKILGDRKLSQIADPFFFQPKFTGQFKRIG